ncbi:Calpain-8 [Cricetulus griseus]|uniref:Calpain-8 n=1 Tax=Cricetulus griseus TaxID=10029 RepID=G3GRB4_CRIGR|nr:Calpain-8 [Cricetulus griseus]
MEALSFFENFPSSSPHPCWTTVTGCLPATYWTNPQFKIYLDEVDEDQEEGTSEPCCTVLLGLMQKNRRRQKRIGQGMLSIGYAIYQVQPSQGALMSLIWMFLSVVGVHLSYCSNTLNKMLSLHP